MRCPKEKPHFKWQACSYEIKQYIISLWLTSQTCFFKIQIFAFIKEMWATYLIFLNISFFMLLTATVVQLLTDKLVEGVKVQITAFT